MIEDELNFAYYETFLPTGNYQVKFTDHDNGRAAWVSDYTFAHEDMEHLKEILEYMTPEFRAFILKVSEMICEAGEAVKTSDREWRFTPEDKDS